MDEGAALLVVVLVAAQTGDALVGRELFCLAAAVVLELELHAVVERLVEGDVVGVLAHQGDGFLLDGAQLVGAVGLSDVVEDAGDLRKDPAGEFQRDDGVLEGGRIRVGGDGVDLGVLLGDAGLDGGDVVGGKDLLERRDAVRGVPFGQEGVFAFVAGCHS